MRLKCFSVYDSKIGAFATPFAMKSKGEALRGWMDVVNDKNTAFNKHPEDYTLFELGEWDDETAQYTNLPAPLAIAPALEYIKESSTSGGNR